MEWIILIVVGAVIGLLGKFVAPGSKDNTPIWLTVILGIVGAVVAGSLAGGIWKWVLAVVIAAVLVVIASTLMGRNTAKR
ncbi:MAG: GlsB/YeaQ/YmgE family stress response membrane protein [Thermocrispum sp.]